MNPHLTLSKQPSRVEMPSIYPNTVALGTHPWFPDIPPPNVNDWLGVTESERHWRHFPSVTDPLQRDANKVHFAATQCLLAAHHTSEQHGRSLQLPRYAKLLIILRGAMLLPHLLVSVGMRGALWMSWRRDTWWSHIVMASLSAYKNCIVS